MTCVLDLCDGSGVIPTADFTGPGEQACPHRYGFRVDEGLRLASLLEAEASYYPQRLIDVGDVAHRIRVTLGMIPK